MSETKPLPRTIPETEHEFELSVQGILTKRQYHGTFKCRIMNVKLRTLAERKRAMLNAGVEAGMDLEYRTMTKMVAFLSYAITEAPKWWNDADQGFELMDGNVVEKVYEQVLAFEDEWYREIHGTEETGGSASASPTS